MENMEIKTVTGDSYLGDWPVEERKEITINSDQVTELVFSSPLPVDMKGDIMLEVVYEFAKQGIPILTVDTGFMVQHQYQEKLKKVMKKHYQRKMNTACSVEITY